MISYRYIELGLRALASIVFYRAAANSAAVKSPEILTSVVIRALQMSDIFSMRVMLTCGLFENL